MKHYIGTKQLKAKPMTLGEYNAYREWKLPQNEDPESEGYLVEYYGDNRNHPEHDGYISWSPKKEFENSYTETFVSHTAFSDFPHEQRVLDEASELATRGMKLEVFINESPIFADLPKDEQDRLKLQSIVMQHYHSILSHRIAHFKLTE